MVGGAKSCGWARKDVLVLLCSLNVHIEEIRREFQSDKKAGIKFATGLLSEIVGGSCTPARVKNKIESLWKNRGRPGGFNEPPDPIYTSGAWTRTLPSLDSLYHGMLDEIALTVKRIQSEHQHDGTPPALATQRERAHNLRRRKSEEDKDPIECKCHFSHYSGDCVHCDECYTWQHVICYYNSDSAMDAPVMHICDDCKPDASLTAGIDDNDTLALEDDKAGEHLINAFRLLQVQSCENDDCMTKNFRGNEQARSSRTASQQIVSCRSDQAEDENDMLWGPEDSDIRLATKLISSGVNRVAHWITTQGFHIVSPAIIDYTSDLMHILHQLSGSRENAQISLQGLTAPPCRPVQALQILIESAIWKWTFYPESIEADSADRILLDNYKATILGQCGFQALRALHRTAWLSSIDLEPGRFDSMVGKEADQLARRLLAMLLTIVTNKSPPPKPLTSADDWIHYTKSGRSLFNIIVEIFVVALRNLKARLPLTEHCYELYTPVAGIDFDHRIMTGEHGSSQNGHNTVRACQTPAIIEYPAEMFQGPGTGIDALFGKQNFVRATDDERAEGRVICPAIVTFQS